MKKYGAKIWKQEQTQKMLYWYFGHFFLEVTIHSRRGGGEKEEDKNMYRVSVRFKELKMTEKTNVDKRGNRRSKYLTVKEIESVI